MGAGEGLGFKREGIYVSLWLINVAAWQKPKQHWKATILQFWGKKKNFARFICTACNKTLSSTERYRKKEGSVDDLGDSYLFLALKVT